MTRTSPEHVLARTLIFSAAAHAIVLFAMLTHVDSLPRLLDLDAWDERICFCPVFIIEPTVTIRALQVNLAGLSSSRQPENKVWHELRGRELDLRDCYAETLRDHPDIRASGAVTFSINARGRVSSLENDEIVPYELRRCVSKVVRSTQFHPEHRGRYRFDLTFHEWFVSY